MYRLKHVFRLILMFAAGLISACDAFATVFFIPAIGDTLDSREAEQYNLFTEVQVFRNARIEPDSLGETRIIVEHGPIGGIQQDTYSVTPAAVQIITIWLEKMVETGRQQTSAGTTRYMIHTTDGYIITGKVEAWTGPEIVIQGPYGGNRIPTGNIASFTEMRGTETVSSKAESEPGEIKMDPNRTRLLFMPTGRSLKRGEAYFSVYEVAFPSFQIGMGKKTSVGGGIFPFSGEEFFFGWLTGQVGIVEREKYAVSVGTLMMFVSAEGASSGGIYYGAGCYGSGNASVSLGLGFGVVEWTHLADKPLIVVGGDLGIGRSTKLVSENWIIPGVDMPVISLGLRWFGERLSADFALIRPLSEEVKFIGIPWVDFVVHF